MDHLVFLMGGYLLFNFMISGSIWPNTLAAKQIEYSILQETPYLTRMMAALAVPFTGVGIFLLPGIIIWFKRAILEKRWIEGILPAWALGYILLYAWKLPVTYQHGRYLIPVIPVLFAIGLKGYLHLNLPDYSSRWKFIFSRVFLAAMVVTTIGFYILGMRAYQRDVDVIQSEMVTSAKWIRDNTSSDSLIAAHDIGALGYFGERRILDLAGLINPEVIPLMNDNIKLSKYIIQMNTDYLVVFPSWYNPPLDVSGTEIYPKLLEASDEQFGEHMTIYELDK